jgi:Glycoside hydrolase family 44
MQNSALKCRAGGKWSCRLLALAFMFQLTARADQIIYDDALQNGWQDWSYSTTRNFNNTGTYVHSGAASISATITSGWGALSLWHSAFDSSVYTNLTFWINGGASGGQQLQIYAELATGAKPAINLPTLAANTWQQISFSLSALGVANQPNFIRFSIQDRSGAAEPTFYVDDIILQAGAPIQPSTNANVTVQIDALANRHVISPLIYGVAFASSNQLVDLNFPVNRSGGNAETRYNWQLNAHNHAADWYFESIDDGSATPGASADDFVANSRNGGAQAMITLPMIGWMPKLGSSRGKLASYSINKYGPQTGSDSQWFPDAGNGVRTNGSLIVTNNPNDANFLTNAAFQQVYVQHLTNRWGVATNGGVRYYLMDNEHSIWFGTHQDVHPVGPTMQEIRDKMFEYASMVKSNDPNALVVGPEEWGWNGYFYSGYDQQWAGQHGDYNPADYPDRTANGGWDYMPWLLDQFHQRATNTNQRLLDYFTVHCYPQGGEGGNDVSTSTQLLRNRSTRQFWDTNYVDPSWINSIVMLIPRMKNWVVTCYPGTKTGITEYNWGAEPSINGATAQADILGIFGREGLDLATRWTTPATNTPTYKAMKLYRNYDGNKSTFGDTSIQAAVPNPDNVAAFAAVRTGDGAMTVMAINKDLNNATPITLNITNFTATGPAQVWQLTSANAISHLSNTGLTNGVLKQVLPPQSVTLFVMSGATPFHLRIGTNRPPGQLELWLDGQAGQSYVLQSGTDLVHWVAVSTNALSSNSFSFLVATTNPAKMFYRGAVNPP